MYESKDVMVSHPSHYKSKNGMEVIDVIEAFTSELKGIDAFPDARGYGQMRILRRLREGLQDGRGHHKIAQPYGVHPLRHVHEGLPDGRNPIYIWLW